MPIDLPTFATYGAVSISSDQALGAFGSGFLLSESNHLFLVTAKHVLDNFQPCLSRGEPGWFDKPQVLFLTGYSPSEDNTGTDVFRFEVNCQKLNSGDEGALDLHDWGTDVCRVKLGAWNGELTPTANIHVRQTMTGRETVFSSDDLRQFVDVPPATDAFLLGFPQSLIRPDFPFLRRQNVLLRKGIVSTKDTLNSKYEFNGKRYQLQDAKIFILDCPIFSGDSGGPIATIIDDEVKLFGVATNSIPVDHDPMTYKKYEHGSTHSGLSVGNSLDRLIESCNT